MGEFIRSKMAYRILIACLISYIALFVYGTIYRYIYIDDAWLGEYAFWQSKLGYVRSELMRGITLQEIRLVCHHKLHTLQGAWIINNFGFSLYALKSISLIYLLIFLISYYFYAYKRYFTKKWFVLSLLLIFSNALIFDFSFVYRPEIPMMTLGFLSFICVDTVLTKAKNRILLSIAGGLLAGLCSATHLNGIIFIAAGVLLLIINNRIWLALLFGLSSLPSISIYFYDFNSNYNFYFWLYQFSESPAIDKSLNLPAGLSHVFSLLSEHMRFFHSPIEITFSLLTIVAAILTYIKLKTHRNLVLYTAILIICLGLLAIHKTSKYLILYLPWLIIILTISLQTVYFKFSTSYSKFANKGFYITTVLFILYFGIHTLYNIKLSTAKFRISENRKFITEHIDEQTDSCRLLAPMTFIFDEINHFKSIQSDMCFSEMQKSKKWIFRQGFLKLTQNYEIDYIILTAEYIRKFGLDHFSDKDYRLNGYELTFKSEKYIVLKNISRYLFRHRTELLNSYKNLKQAKIAKHS